MPKIDRDAYREGVARELENLIREHGEEVALPLILAVREETERLSAECRFVIGAQSTFAKRCEAEKVSRQKKTLPLPANVIQFRPRGAA